MFLWSKFYDGCGLIGFVSSDFCKLCCSWFWTSWFELGIFFFFCFFREEAESGECETRDSYSDSYSEESESDKLWRWDGTSSEEGGSEHDCLWHMNDRLGHLYFQYFDRSTPYGRVPLMDKVRLFCSCWPFLTFFFAALLVIRCAERISWFSSISGFWF